MDSDLQKQAAVAIRHLRDENEELKELLHKHDEAVKLAFFQFSSGFIMAEDLESAVEKYSQKSLEELKILQKAAELTKTASNMSSFRLSSNAAGLDASLDNPINRMLLDDL